MQQLWREARLPDIPHSSQPQGRCENQVVLRLLYTTRFTPGDNRDCDNRCGRKACVAVEDRLGCGRDGLEVEIFQGGKE
jgi:hypothetical protein